MPSSHYPESGYDSDQTHTVSVQSLWPHLAEEEAAASETLRGVQISLLECADETQQERGGTNQTTTNIGDMGRTSSTDIQQCLFQEACKKWLEERKGHLAEKTFKDYGCYIKTMAKWFGTFRLNEISADMALAYQNDRMAECPPNPRGGAPGAAAINHELKFLDRVRRSLGMNRLDFHELPVPKGIAGHAMNQEEKDRLKRIARENPRWHAAYLFLVISVNTSAGPKETFTLHLKNVNVEEKWVEVHPEGAKNRHRVRRCYLNDEAFAAVVEALERAKQLGAHAPEHYLFPFRMTRSNRYDPTRHQTSIKTAWSTLRKKAALPNLRPYDLRHTVATDLLTDSTVSTKTAIDFCGWISPQMIKKYGHADVEARREAADRLIQRKAEKKIRERVKKEKEADSSEVAKALTQALEMLGKQNAQTVEMLAKLMSKQG